MQLYEITSEAISALERIVNTLAVIVRAYVTAVLSPVTVQDGVDAYGSANVTVHEVVTSVPMVTFPTRSDPLTLGVVPHEVSTGSGPVVMV